MFIRKLIPILAVICIFAMNACQQEDPLQPEDSTPVNTSIDDTPVILTPEATFAALRTTFALPRTEYLLKLKTITEKKRYLAFLAQEYPTKEPFHNFDEFIQATEPPRERYLPFLKTITENPTDNDVDIFHYIVEEFRKTNALLYHFRSNPLDEFEKKFSEILSKETAVFETREVQQWLEAHNVDVIVDFYLSLKAFIVELEKEDTARIQQLFNEHGEDDGTIWLAILQPTLTAHIVNNFTDIHVFKDWVNGELFTIDWLKWQSSPRTFQ